MGGVRLRYGPSRNVQFSFVLLNRALLHHMVVAGRTHAQRDALNVRHLEGETAEASRFVAGSTRELARLFGQLRRSEPGTQARAVALVSLTEAIKNLITSQDDDGTGAGHTARSTDAV